MQRHGFKHQMSKAHQAVLPRKVFDDHKSYNQRLLEASKRTLTKCSVLLPRKKMGIVQMRKDKRRVRKGIPHTVPLLTADHKELRIENFLEKKKKKNYLFSFPARVRKHERRFWHARLFLPALLLLGADIAPSNIIPKNSGNNQRNKGICDRRTSKKPRIEAAWRDEGTRTYAPAWREAGN